MVWDKWDYDGTKAKLEEERIQKLVSSLRHSFAMYMGAGDNLPKRKYHYKALKGKVKMFLIYMKFYDIDVRNENQVISAAREILRIYTDEIK